MDLEMDMACRVVAASLAQRGVVTTWQQLCSPALVQLDGQASDADGGCTDAQLLLSWAVASALRRLPGPTTASTQHRVLLGCAPHEQHTLALEALLAALVERGVPVQMLGPAAPTVALQHATEQLQPAVVVVWAQCTATAQCRPTTPDRTRRGSSSGRTGMATHPAAAHRAARQPLVHDHILHTLDDQHRYGDGRQVGRGVGEVRGAGQHLGDVGLHLAERVAQLRTVPGFP
jgi:hypothetical protein